MKLSSEQNHEMFGFEALDSSTGIGTFISWDKNLLNAEHQEQKSNCRNPKWSLDI